jgi:hypothetical protein
MGQVRKSKGWSSLSLSQKFTIEIERSNVRKALEALDDALTYHVSVKSPDRPR